MLLGFGGKNILSFKEGFDIRFELDKNCPSDISKNKEYANMLAVVGANASGKTNVLNALTFILFFIKSSFQFTPKENIPLRQYRGLEENTELYIDFLIDDEKYTYEIELNKEEVIKEKIYINSKLAFSREKDTLKIEDKNFDDLLEVKEYFL